MKNFRAADKSHAGGDEKHDINFHWPYQGRLKVDNLGGGQIFIYSCSASFISFESDCFYSL